MKILVALFGTHHVYMDNIREPGCHETQGIAYLTNFKITVANNSPLLFLFPLFGHGEAERVIARFIVTSSSPLPPFF
jgi:hypothetical protein